MPTKLFALKQTPKSELYCYQQIWESNPEGPSQDPTQLRSESAAIAYSNASLSGLDHFATAFEIGLRFNALKSPLPTLYPRGREQLVLQSKTSKRGR
jgi:hypothetical protein